jgi:hypothetical protein
MPDPSYGPYERQSGLSDTERSRGPVSATLEPRGFLTEGAFGPSDPSPAASGVYEFRDDYAPWVKRTVESMRSVFSLPHNWDSYGAPRIAFENVKYAFNLLVFTMDDNTPPPNVVPTPEGSVQLEWHEGGIDLELEVISPYRIYASYEDQDDPEASWEDELTIDLTRVGLAIDEISVRASRNQKR